MVRFDAAHSVTSPAQWAADARWERVEAVDVASMAAGGVVVFSAHPDDETLGVGGLVARLADRDGKVHVVVATDMAGRRQKELRRALDVLHPGATMTSLGLPDGELSAHIPRLEADVREVIARSGGATFLAPWPEDRHGDHRALGHVVSEAAERAGTRALLYPVWLWQWGEPDDLPWERALQIRLPAEARRRKAAALAQFASQLTATGTGAPVLTEEFLRHAGGEREVLIRASGHPDPRQELADHFERLHAERKDPWSVETDWFERRKRNLILASLPNERYDSALELGCSVGANTAELAARARSVLAIDGSISAVERARSRTSRLGNVRVERMRLPRQWPPGEFDLVVVAEIGYYLDEEEWLGVIRSLTGCLAAGGDVVLCHWCGSAEDFRQSAAAVHETFARAARLQKRVTHHEEDFLLEVFRSEGQAS